MASLKAGNNGMSKNGQIMDVDIMVQNTLKKLALKKENSNETSTEKSGEATLKHAGLHLPGFVFYTSLFYSLSTVPRDLVPLTQLYKGILANNDVLADRKLNRPHDRRCDPNADIYRLLGSFTGKGDAESCDWRCGDYGGNRHLRANGRYPTRRSYRSNLRSSKFGPTQRF